MNFSRRLDLFQDEIFASLQKKSLELEAKGRKLYNLYVGTPDFPVEKHIREALINAAADPNNWKYSLRDIPQLQDALIDYYQNRFGVEISADMIQSCSGSQVLKPAVGPPVHCIGVRAPLLCIPLASAPSTLGSPTRLRIPISSP